MSAVGIQECSADINNGFSSPMHNKTRLLSYYCNRNCLQVFLCGKCQEFFYVCRIQNDSHTLLRFGNGDLCAVQTCVLFRNLV